MNHWLKVLMGCLVGITGMQANADELRIVTVGGGATEVVFALGAEDAVVGVDTSSTWPLQVKNLPQVGYQRTLAPEGILSLKPTVLIGTEEAGPIATLQHLEKAGVEVMILPSAPTIDTVKERINKVAVFLNKSQQGDVLWKAVESDLAAVEKQKAKITQPKKVLFLLVVPGRAPMVAGKHTQADTMIQLTGAKNAATEFESYRVLTPEALQQYNPDVILLTTEGLDSLGGEEHVWALPGIQHTQAAKTHRLIHMDAGFLLNFGPRTGEAALFLINNLYPDTK